MQRSVQRSLRIFANCLAAEDAPASILVVGPVDQMILEGIEHMEELGELRAYPHWPRGLPLIGLRTV